MQNDHKAIIHRLPRSRLYLGWILSPSQTVIKRLIAFRIGLFASGFTVGMFGTVYGIVSLVKVRLS